MAGAAMIYLYAQGKQQYTASVVLKYTNDGIKDGYAPDGSDLDVNEIYSSTVIAQAMDSSWSIRKTDDSTIELQRYTDYFRGTGEDQRCTDRKGRRSHLFSGYL